MRVAIDQQLCAGHGQCAALCPEVFDVDANGFGVVLHSGRVAPADVDDARLAIASCPEGAISECSGDDCPDGS